VFGVSDAAGKDAARKITMPVELAGCHALIEQLSCIVDSQSYTIEQLSCTVDSQAQSIEQLRREKQEAEAAFAEYIERLFRKRSERYLQDPNQLRLDLGNTEDAADAAEGLAQAMAEAGQTIEVPAHQRRRRQRADRKEELPAHLPRYQVEAKVPEEQKRCPEHGEKTLIGYDTVETLEFQRPLLRVRVTKYAKYACPNHAECGVASPERPTGLVEGNRYDTSVAAEIITAKYGFHCVQGKDVSEMREGPSWSGGRTRPQTSPTCGGQEPSWGASGAKGATLIALGAVCEVERK
jgi:transposase